MAKSTKILMILSILAAISNGVLGGLIYVGSKNDTNNVSAAILMLGFLLVAEFAGIVLLVIFSLYFARKIFGEKNRWAELFRRLPGPEVLWIIFISIVLFVVGRYFVVLVVAILVAIWAGDKIATFLRKVGIKDKEIF